MNAFAMLLAMLVAGGTLGVQRPVDSGTLAHAQHLQRQDTSRMILRRVWSGPQANALGRVTPDGRYLTFVYWPDVGLRDMQTGALRRVTDAAAWDTTGGYADMSVVSPDGKRVAYQWAPGWWAWALEVIDLDGSNRKTLLSGTPGTPGEAYPMDWTPDGRDVLTSIRREDGSTALALVSASTGAVQVLTEVGQRLLDNGRFSPDGRYVVYNALVSQQSKRDIFVLSVADHRVHELVAGPADDAVLGWVPGTDSVLFSSDRTGTRGIWVVPVKDGRPAGSPTLVKPDLWQEPWPLGFTADGAFYYGIRMSTYAVRLATIDPESKRLLSEPTLIDPRQDRNSMRPRWSPDGRYLSYLKTNGSPLHQIVVIRSMETGETREIETGLLQGGCSARWSPDARSFAMCGRDSTGHRGLFQVDVQTGKTVPLKLLENGGVSFWTDWAPDGKTVYYRVDYGEESRIQALDLQTGAERTVRSAHSPSWIVMIYVDVSPDGRQLAFWESEQGTGNWRLLVTPTSGKGGDAPAREVLTLEHRNRPIMGVNWSRDGKYLLYMYGEDSASRLWRVPAAGGDPEPLDLVLPSPLPRPPLFSPDGRRIAFEGGESSWEIWVMKNFLPKE
jgi:Tol biopolymer transport system component